MSLGLEAPVAQTQKESEALPATLCPCGSKALNNQYCVSVKRV